MIDFNSAIDSSAKYVLDLTHLISLTIDKKHENVLIIKHPIIDLALRFKTSSLFMSWLKVLSSFTLESNQSGPKIETSIPSNYSYSIWNVLQSLYTHPKLCKIEGIFRISSNKNERKLIFNDLLQQTYHLSKLQNYKNIHVLANTLSALLTNLPSTIFKEKQIEDLIKYFDEITNRNQKNGVGLDIFKSNNLLKKSASHMSEDYNNNNNNDDTKREQEHVDDEVAKIPIDILNKLKLRIEKLYCTSPYDKNRYGLLTLIFHLLKQIIIHEKRTKMTANHYREYLSIYSNQNIFNKII